MNCRKPTFLYNDGGYWLYSPLFFEIKINLRMAKESICG